jgi:hypothetical protein
MIDVRKRIKDLFDQYSHDVVYIRRDLRFRCECYVERSGEPSAKCPKCFGSGYVVKIQKLRARRNITTSTAFPSANQVEEAGRMSPKTYVYYFEHDAKPEANDLILEVIWDISGVPRYIKEKNLISAVEPKFGFKGRTEFYQVYCRFDQKGVSDDQALTEH